MDSSLWLSKVSSSDAGWSERGLCCRRLFFVQKADAHSAGCCDCTSCNLQCREAHTQRPWQASHGFATSEGWWCCLVFIFVQVHRSSSSICRKGSLPVFFYVARCCMMAATRGRGCCQSFAKCQCPRHWSRSVSLVIPRHLCKFEVWTACNSLSSWCTPDSMLLSLGCKAFSPSGPMQAESVLKPRITSQGLPCQALRLWESLQPSWIRASAKAPGPESSPGLLWSFIWIWRLYQQQHLLPVWATLNLMDTWAILGVDIMASTSYSRSVSVEISRNVDRSSVKRERERGGTVTPETGASTKVDLKRRNYPRCLALSWLVLKKVFICVYIHINV